MKNKTTENLIKEAKGKGLKSIRIEDKKSNIDFDKIEDKKELEEEGYRVIIGEGKLLKQGNTGICSLLIQWD